MRPEFSLEDWVGVNVDIFAQFTHCLVVLFKLTVLEEPGWDVAEVKRRANVLRIRDHYRDKIELVPQAIELVDAPGSRCGLFSKRPTETFSKLLGRS